MDGEQRISLSVEKPQQPRFPFLLTFSTRHVCFEFFFFFLISLFLLLVFYMIGTAGG